MLRLSRRLRFVAACSMLISADGLHARCTSIFHTPPVYWREFDFRRELHEPATGASEPFCSLTASFVSPLLPGQFDTPVRTISAGDGDERDTCFRDGVPSIEGSAGFPSELDGAAIDVTLRSTAVVAFVEFAFTNAKPAQKEPWSSWTVEARAELSQNSPLIQRSPLASPETWATLSPDAWKIAELPDETGEAISWLYSKNAAERSSRRLVFDQPYWGGELMASSALDRNETSLRDELVEAPAAGPVVATFVVSVPPRCRCRVAIPGIDDIVYRFPIPLATGEF